MPVLPWQKAKQRKKKGDQAAAAAGGEASDSALGASASGVDILKEAAEAASAALAARKEAVSWYIDHAESIHDAASDLEARLHKAAELEIGFVERPGKPLLRNISGPRTPF